MAEMEKKTVNAMGDVCPVPLVKAKNAIAELAGSGKVEDYADAWLYIHRKKEK